MLPELVVIVLIIGVLVGIAIGCVFRCLYEDGRGPLLRMYLIRGRTGNYRIGVRDGDDRTVLMSPARWSDRERAIDEGNAVLDSRIKWEVKE